MVTGVIAVLVVFIVCEGIGSSSTPDIWDAVAYFVGGVFVLLWKMLAEIYWPTAKIILIGVFVILSINLLTRSAMWQRTMKQKVIKAGQVILAIIVLGLTVYYIVFLHFNIFSGEYLYMFHWSITVIALTIISRIYILIRNYKERKQIGAGAALPRQKISMVPYIVGSIIVYMASAGVPFHDNLLLPYVFRTSIAALMISVVAYIAVKICKEIKKGKTLKDISFGAILAGMTFLVLFISGVFLSVPWFPQPIVLLPLTMFYLGKIVEDIGQDSTKLRESPFFKLAILSVLLTTLAMVNIFVSIIYLRPLVAESLIARFFAHYFNDLCATGLFTLLTPALAGYVRAIVKGNIEGKTGGKVKKILTKKFLKHKISKGITNRISKRSKDWIRAAGLTVFNIVIIRLSRDPAPKFGILVVLLGWAVWWAGRVIVEMILKEHTRVKIQTLASKIIPEEYSHKLSSSFLRLIGTTFFWAIGLSVVCEGIGFSSTPDVWDTVVYFAGGALFILFWKILGVSFWQV